jgi:hypothetical protein
MPVAAADFDTSLVSPMTRDWAVTAMTVGQFKGDGHPDAAVAGNVGSSIRVMLGNGDGTFRFGANYAVFASPIDLTNADLRGMGKLDLVVATGSSVVVLLGNGDGTFQAAQAVVGSLNNARRVLTADLRGNGRTDILVVSSSGISVLLGNGDGTFQAPITTALTAPYGVVVGDLSGSGHPDLIYGTSIGFEVRAGMGDGTFGTGIGYTGGTTQFDLVLAPLHGGSALDLAAINMSPNQVTVFTGNGDRTFQAPGTSYAIGTFGNLSKIAAADLRGAGVLDLVVTGSDVHVLAGRGDGTFLPPNHYPVADWLNGLAITDLRGTGVNDIVLGRLFGRNIAVLLGAGDGTFPTMRVAHAHNQPVGIAAGDFGTGHLSLAVQNARSNDLSIVLGNGDGTFQAPVNYPWPAPPPGSTSGRTLVVGDFRNNGILDIAALSGSGLAIFRGNGDGSFELASSRPFTGATTMAIAMADLRGTSRLDLLLVTLGTNRLEVLLNNGDGTFADPVPYNLPGPGASVVAADFRGIGIMDVAVTSIRSVLVLRGNGDGTFGRMDTYPGAGLPFALVAGPLRQPGLVDLAYTSLNVQDTNTGTVEILLNDGAGGFTVGPSYEVGGYPQDIVAVDLDGCGRLDLITADATSGAVSVLKSLGGGSFAPARHYGAGIQALSLVVGDFSEDGRLDIATASGDDVDLLMGI